MSRWGSGNSLSVFGVLPLEPRWFGQLDLALFSPPCRTFSPAGGRGRARVLPEPAGRGPSPAVQSAPSSVRPNCRYLLHNQPPSPSFAAGAGRLGEGARFQAAGAWKGQGAPGMGGARGKRSCGHSSDARPLLLLLGTPLSRRRWNPERPDHPPTPSRDTEGGGIWGPHLGGSSPRAALATSDSLLGSLLRTPCRVTDQEPYANCPVQRKSLGSRKPRLPSTNQLEKEAGETKDVKEN